MEYLPEKKRTQQTQIMKKEKRIREFRHELVDNNVVLAIVKCKSTNVPCFQIKDSCRRLTHLNALCVNRLGRDEKLVAVTRGPNIPLHGLCW